MKKLTKKQLLFFIFTLQVLTVGLMISAQSARADYSESINVNGFRDSEYTKIIEDPIIYYANSNETHYLFIPLGYNTSTAYVNVHVFSNKFDYKFSLAPNVSKFSSKVLEAEKSTWAFEMCIDRATIGNNFTININGIPQTSLDLVPAERPRNYKTGGSDEDEGIPLRLGDIVKALIEWVMRNGWLSWVFALAFVAIVARIIRVLEKPYANAKDIDTGKAMYLGRFIREVKSKYMPDFWILWYERRSKVVRYYCKMNHKALESYLYDKRYVVQEVFADVVHSVVDLKDKDKVKRKYKGDSMLPPELQEKIDKKEILLAKIPKLKRKEGKKNYAIYLFYRLITAIVPSTKISDWAFQLVPREETGEYYKRIPILRLQFLMKELTTTVDIEYEKRVVGAEKKVWVMDSEKGKPLTHFNDLKNNKDIQNIKITKIHQKLESIGSISHALKNRKSKLELLNVMDLRQQKFDEQIQGLIEMLTESKMTNQSITNEFWLKVMDKIQQMGAMRDMDDTDLMNALSVAIQLKEAGGDIEDIHEEAVRTYLSSKDHKQYGDLMARNKQLEAELKYANERIKELQAQLNKIMPMLAEHKFGKGPNELNITGMGE